MNDKQNPQGQGNNTGSNEKSEVRTETNEDSLVDLAHSVKNGNKSRFEQNLHESSDQNSDGVRFPTDSSEIPSNEGQGEDTGIDNDQMNEIAKKLEDDLLSELQTTLENPLEGNSKDDSNQNDLNLPNRNSLSDAQTQVRSDRYPAAEREYPGQDSNQGSQETGSIPNSGGEGGNLNVGNSESNRENGRNAGDLSGIRRYPAVSAGPTERNQSEIRNQRSDSNQRSSFDRTNLEDSSSHGMIHDSSQAMTGLNGDSDVLSGENELGEIQNRQTDSQMTLPGMDESRNSIPSAANDQEESETTREHASLGTLPPLSRSVDSSELNQDGSNRGLTVALLGLALMLLFGGAFIAVRSITADSNIEEPPIVFADNSPMKILPETDENDEARSANDKVIFDRVGEVFQENENVETLVEPEESKVAAEISEQIANEVPITTESNVPARQVRTVVLQPDGTVIEGESQTGASNDSSGTSAGAGENQTDQKTTANEADGNEVSADGNEASEGEDSTVADSKSDSGDVVAEVEQLLSESSSDGSGEAAVDSGNASEEDSGSQTLPDNQENTVESESETTSPIADIIENSDNAPLQDPIEENNVSALEPELQPELQPESQLSYVLPRKKPANLGEGGFAAAGAIANTPLEVKELQEGTPVVQVLADKSIESARESYSNIRDRHPQIFEKLSPIIQVGETETGTWYRVQIEMDGYLNAIDFCSYLKSQGIDCVAKRVDG